MKLSSVKLTGASVEERGSEEIVFVLQLWQIPFGYCKYTFHRERSAPSLIIQHEYEIKRIKKVQPTKVNCELPPAKFIWEKKVYCLPYPAMAIYLVLFLGSPWFQFHYVRVNTFGSLNKKNLELGCICGVFLLPCRFSFVVFFVIL